MKISKLTKSSQQKKFPGLSLYYYRQGMDLFYQYKIMDALSYFEKASQEYPPTCLILG